MNNRTSFALLALLTIVGTLTVSLAYAQEQMSEPMGELSEIPQACIGCTTEEARATAEQLLLEDTPISVWTDKTEYGHNDMILVEGYVANVASGFEVTVSVFNSLNSFVTADQIPVDDDGSFSTSINTGGNILKYDGTYTIRVNYGSAENSAEVELTGGVEPKIIYDTRDMCKNAEISAGDQCIPFSITGGMVTSATLNPGENGSIIINIDAQEDGTLTVNPSMETIEEIFFVLVDDEECDEPECVIDGNTVTVMFSAGTETIEIVGANVIPEFGAIAAMILAVAIISIIAISAKSRLAIIPRY